jgi:uncharacterized protein YegP (UPF0339 family)
MTKSGKFQAKIKYNGKTLCFGNYASAKSAKRVIDIIRSIMVTAEVASGNEANLRAQVEGLTRERDAVLASKCALDSALALTIIAERDSAQARVAELEAFVHTSDAAKTRLAEVRAEELRQLNVGLSEQLAQERAAREAAEAKLVGEAEAMLNRARRVMEDMDNGYSSSCEYAIDELLERIAKETT